MDKVFAKLYDKFKAFNWKKKAIIVSFACSVIFLLIIYTKIALALFCKC